MNDSYALHTYFFVNGNFPPREYSLKLFCIHICGKTLQQSHPPGVSTMPINYLLPGKEWLGRRKTVCESRCSQENGTGQMKFSQTGKFHDSHERHEAQKHRAKEKNTFSL